MSQLISNAVNFVKENIIKIIQEDSIVIDATIGNGYDTLFLRKHLGDQGFLYGFDIQEKALQSTKERLVKNACFNKVKLIHDSHENFRKYVDCPVDLILYNLGYLPKGDKNITTESTETLESVKEGMSLLKSGGVIIITVYPGHLPGALELEVLSNYLETIDQKEYAVMKIDFFNYKNKPPVVFMIERR
jgi:methylase of polypeptide subunit release factors